MGKFGLTFIFLVLSSVGQHSLAGASNDTAIADTTHIIAKVDWPYDFFLCQSDHSGELETYSCRDYLQNDNAYRLFYKGGTVPTAAAMVNGRLPNESLQFFDLKKIKLPVYGIAPPEGLPRGARFIGTGVCADETGEQLPCGVFEHKPARNPNTYNYMVFYHDFGGGPIKIASQVVGTNANAMPAEMAYQIGLGLVKTDCCAGEGLAYLEFAYKLFPDSEIYRQAYERHRTGRTRLASQ